LIFHSLLFICFLCFQQKHANIYSNETCTECNTAKPKQTEKFVTCTECTTNVIVPTSNASKHVKEAAFSTKRFVSNAATATKNSFEYLKADPQTFHCKQTKNKKIQKIGIMHFIFYIVYLMIFFFLIIFVFRFSL
jgi:hypothetical protein